MNLSERLATIRREIEQTFLLKEERVKRVNRQYERIKHMERNRRPKEEIKKEEKELGKRVDDMEGLLKVLAQTRDGEEEVFLKIWHLQHDE
jgi:aminopeptidase-like protein